MADDRPVAESLALAYPELPADAAGSRCEERAPRPQLDGQGRGETGVERRLG
jgi:hypothetical protein